MFNDVFLQNDFVVSARTGVTVGTKDKILCGALKCCMGLRTESVVYPHHLGGLLAVQIGELWRDWLFQTIFEHRHGYLDALDGLFCGNILLYLLSCRLSCLIRHNDVLIM